MNFQMLDPSEQNACDSILYGSMNWSSDRIARCQQPQSTYQTPVRLSPDSMLKRRGKRSPGGSAKSNQPVFRSSLTGRDCSSSVSHSFHSGGSAREAISPTDLRDPLKKCKVCGDRAVNHNFGQLTCESCKAFFRRNAHKVLPAISSAMQLGGNGQPTTASYLKAMDIGLGELICTSKTGEHLVSPSTRRECPACRLKRCFLIGMRPDLIQVRKKDGSKPRWLDKAPVAAHVHEQHLMRTDLNSFPISDLPSPTANPPLPSQAHSSKVPTIDSFNKIFRKSSSPSAPNVFVPSDFGEGGGVGDKEANLQRETYQGREAAYRSVKSEDLIYGVECERGPSMPMNVYLEQHQQQHPVFRLPLPKAEEVMLLKQQQQQTNTFDYPTSDCVLLTNSLADESFPSKPGNWAGAPQSQDNSFMFASHSWFTENPQPQHISPQQHSNLQFVSHLSSELVPHPLDNLTTEQTPICLFSNLHLQNYHQSFGHGFQRFTLDSQSAQNFSNAIMAPHSGTLSGSTTSPSISSVSNFPDIGSSVFDNTKQSALHSPSDADWLGEGDYNTQIGSLHHRLQHLSHPRPLSNDPFFFKQELACGFPQNENGFPNYFSRLTSAWKASWLDGVFPNPANVSLHLDLNETPPLRWCLTLANLWVDLLLRRAIDFAYTLFDRGASSKLDMMMNRDAPEGAQKVSNPSSSSTSSSPICGDGLHVSDSIFFWICKNRLINCIPIILTRSLFHIVTSIGGRIELSPCATTPQGSPQDPNIDSCSSSFDPETGELNPAHTSVYFQVPPHHRVFISLSKLSAKFAELTNTADQQANYSASYPMLKYLDAYVCELHKFLTEHPIMLAAFMAIKMTEPLTAEEIQQAPLSDEDRARMHDLNCQFMQVFCIAADQVASENPEAGAPNAASSANGATGGVASGEELRESLHRAKAMTDALSRRTKLPDFLSWGRQFDANMRDFLMDTWTLASRHAEQVKMKKDGEDGGGSCFISHGLYAFAGHGSPIHLVATSPTDECLKPAANDFTM